VNFVLGPYFANQALKAPRHLLFTLARYKCAAKMLIPGVASSVLELGCGEGFGTLLLAEGENDVTGVDFDDAAIDHAQVHIDSSN
jgi:2-polyprenyl-3-methyl-5-hydroxy-6-metoxy-1,4-benzoquinol methylase